MKIIELKKEDIRINKKRLDRRITKSSAELPDWLKPQIEECLEDCNINPKGIFSFFNCEIDSEKDIITIEDTIFHSSFMAKRFKYAKEAGLFVATVGFDPTIKCREAYKNKEGVKALIYDSIGSEYAESTANEIHKIIEKEKGYCMKRYSPGYNDWDISEQELLFKLVSGNKIGINLTEGSFLMQPEKSVSAMIGYSDKNMEGCKVCTKKDCSYRNLINY